MTSLRQRMIEDMQIRNLAVSTQQEYIQQVLSLTKIPCGALVGCENRDKARLE